MKNSNDSVSKYYNIVSNYIKPTEITKQEISLIKDIKAPGVKVLDIGCGTGRHSIPLIENGYEVYGVEESEGMLNQLKFNIKDQSSERDPGLNPGSGYASHFQNISIFDFQSEVKFDLIVMFWNTFNEIALSDEIAVELVRKLETLLSPSGQILINSDNPGTRSSDLYNYNYSISKDNVNIDYSWEVLSKDVNNVTTSHETINVTTNSESKFFETTIKQRWYSVLDYKNLFEKFNFKVEERHISGSGEMYLLISRV